MTAYSDSPALDPILVELINNELSAITEEMAIVIWKSGQSPGIKSADFATAVTDRHGRVAVPGMGAAFQLPLCSQLVTYISQKFDGKLAPGDIVISNDPFTGMTHLPDIALVAPVFWKERVVAFTFAYSHHSDIGGRFPGGVSSHSATLYEEGVRLPTVRLRTGGVRNDELLDTVLANVRAPTEWLFDLQAKIAGCDRGCDSLMTLLGKYGVDTFETACDHLVAYGARSARAALEKVPDGRYTEQIIVNEDGVSTEGELRLELALSIDGDRIEADFSGTSAQLPTALNLPMSMTIAAVYGGVHCVLGKGIAANTGFFSPIKVTAPSGSLVNPVFPAAVAGRAPIFFYLIDMVIRALAQAMPESVPASFESADALHFQSAGPGNAGHAVYDLFFGGWGARPTKDGIDGVAPMYVGSYGCVQVELLERDFPIVVEGFGFVADSGGAGRFRGSLAVYRQWRFLMPGQVMVRTCRVTEPFGLAGGRGGHRPETILSAGESRVVIPTQTHVHFDVNAGDRLFHATAGAGGHGDPLAREPDAVLADVLEEKVTPGEALRAYGVAISTERPPRATRVADIYHEEESYG